MILDANALSDWWDDEPSIVPVLSTAAPPRELNLKEPGPQGILLPKAVLGAVNK